jgi:hypothetical protein
LDFRNRLVAKFAIPRDKDFWGAGFEQIPQNALFPEGDKVLDLCMRLKSDLKQEFQPGDLGEFVREWADLEGYLLETARHATEKNVSVREAIQQLSKKGVIPYSLAAQIEAIRHVRNNLIHKPGSVEPSAAREGLEQVREILRTLRREREDHNKDDLWGVGRRGRLWRREVSAQRRQRDAAG